MNKKLYFSLMAIFSVAFIRPDKKEIPKGMVRLTFYTYLGETEVSMKEWKEFMLYRQDNFGESILKYRPDFERISLDWKVNSHLSEAFDAGQLDWLPVVGIKYEDVLRFVQFKNEQERVANKNSAEFKKIEYFLPNSEMDTLLGTHNSFISGAKWSQVSSDNIPVCVVRNKEGQSTLGLYHYHDNVSEMSAKKGFALRGNYRTGKLNAGLGSEQEYLVPSGWIGFRMAARVIQE